jgi:hypothetical protein
MKIYIYTETCTMKGHLVPDCEVEQCDNPDENPDFEAFDISETDPYYIAQAAMAAALDAPGGHGAYLRQRARSLFDAAGCDGGHMQLMAEAQFHAGTHYLGPKWAARNCLEWNEDFWPIIDNNGLLTGTVLDGHDSCAGKYALTRDDRAAVAISDLPEAEQAQILA